ncbi:von Willebrand factor-like [Ptychodera flava]|uniref:von Willebrand factor-like n=1 Tax=Ptychodera flava TaxID=63121 RepID=UPI00396A51F1
MRRPWSLAVCCEQVCLHGLLVPKATGTLNRDVWFEELRVEYDRWTSWGLALVSTCLSVSMRSSSEQQGGYDELEENLHSLKSHDEEIHEHELTKRRSFLIIRIGLPRLTGQCTTWGRYALHYRTFDGKRYSYRGSCTYTLVSECFSGSFEIFVSNDASCSPDSVCNRSLIVNAGESTEELVLRRDNGEAAVFVGGDRVNVPGQNQGYLIEQIAGYVVVDNGGLGFRIIWDGADVFTVELTNQDLKTRTCGLCGKWNDNINDEFTTPNGDVVQDIGEFGDSWRDNQVSEVGCENNPRDIPSCKLTSHNTEPQPDDTEEEIRAKRAVNTCRALDHEPFASCHETVPVKAYKTACNEDMCSCSEENLEACKCSAFAAYARECARMGAPISWRSDDLCPVSCPNGMVFTECDAKCPQTCQSKGEGECEPDECIDGCLCPSGTYLHDGECIDGDQCPCYHNSVEYPAASILEQDCNQCECIGGSWSQCTDNICEATCRVFGDPHYSTFDGTNYDFMGDCTYVLLKDCTGTFNNYHVWGKNVECGRSEGLTCTRAVIVEVDNTLVYLKRGGAVNVNGDDVGTLPFKEESIYIERVSSMFVKVELQSIGVKILWDGRSRVYITVSPKHFGKTCGLCGTYNNNQLDDFWTIQGDVETSIAEFANKYKTNPGCQDVPKEEPPNPCEVFSQHVSVAERLCGHLLNDEIFKACHNVVAPKPYYD